jgi:hypothetical protein
MTARPLILIRAACIALLISMLPPAVYAQQQQEQPATPPSQEKTAEEPSQQEATVPDQSQPGSVVVPEKENTDIGKTETESPQAENGKYTIKRGDTLWDISNMFMKDPFLWPFIWKANQYITNPDLIYPGNLLVIPSITPIERAIEEQPEVPEQLVEKPTTTEKPAEKPQVVKKPVPPQPAPEEEVAKKTILLPEETHVPIMDKYSMLNAGFVNQEETKDVIIDSKEGKTILGYDDIVYVRIRSRKDVTAGDKFLLFRPLKRVVHPVTGKQFGRLIKILGILEIVEQGRPGSGVYSARITRSFDYAENGDMLTPYQEPTLIYEQTPEKSKDITGYILAVMDGRTINAQQDIVYLDKGSADGVDPGDRFIVYTKPHNMDFPKDVRGEVQVFLVKEHTSTAVVIKSNNYLAKGNRIEYKK